MKTTNLDFYKVSKVYGDSSSDNFIHLFLDADKYDKITAFNFVQKGFDHLTNQLVNLRESILGKRLNEAREIDLGDSSFLNIPHLIFLDLIEEFKGGKSIEDLSPQDSLICRCFGINASQIKKMMKVNPDFTKMDVTDQLNAGGGCTNCTGEIEEIVKTFKIVENIESISPLKRYFGKTPADFLMEVDKSLNNIFGGEIKIIRLRGDFLFLQSKTVSKEDIKKHLDKEFSPHFPVALLFV